MTDVDKDRALSTFLDPWLCAIGMKDIHTVNEYIAVEDLARTSRIATSFITG